MGVDSVARAAAFAALNGGGSGTSNYNDLTNKPQINGVTLAGNKSFSDLGLGNVLTYKGTKETYAEIAAITEKAIGDVWFCNEDESEYAWQGNKWEKLGTSVSLVNYYTKTETNTLLDTKQNTITSSNKLDYSLLSNTPTIPVVPTNVSAFTNDAGYLTSHQSLADYSTTTQMNTAISTATNDMATETWVEGKGYLTEHQSLDDYYTSQEVDTLLDDKQNNLTAGSNISISNNTISATDTTYTAGSNVSIVDNVISATDTTYNGSQDITITNNNIQTIYGGGDSQVVTHYFTLAGLDISPDPVSGAFIYDGTGSTVGNNVPIDATIDYFFNLTLNLDGTNYSLQKTMKPTMVQQQTTQTNLVFMNLGDREIMAVRFEKVFTDAFKETVDHINVRLINAATKTGEVRKFTYFVFGHSDRVITPISTSFMPIDNSTITINNNQLKVANPSPTFQYNSSTNTLAITG